MKKASGPKKATQASSDILVRFLEAYPFAPSLALWRALEAGALAHVPFESPVLDLGCGTGQFSEILFGAGLAAGCDLDAGAVEEAQVRNIYQEVVVADARALPYDAEAFRTVFSNCAIEHISDVQEALAEVARVLCPGGLFVFTVPSKHFNDWLFFPRLYYRLGLRRQAQTHISYYNSLQEHHNIDSFPVWQKRLEQVGLHVVEHRYYMPARAALVFSFWDQLAKWTIPIPLTGRQVPVLDCLLDCVPRRILIWAWLRYLGRYLKMPEDSSQGSGLLVVARKKR